MLREGSAKKSGMPGGLPTCLGVFPVKEEVNWSSRGSIEVHYYRLPEGFDSKHQGAYQNVRVCLKI